MSTLRLPLLALAMLAACGGPGVPEGPGALLRQPIVNGTPMATNPGQTVLLRDAGINPPALVGNGVMITNDWVLTANALITAAMRADPRRIRVELSPTTYTVVREILVQPVASAQAALLRLETPLPVGNASSGWWAERYGVSAGAVLRCTSFGLRGNGISGELHEATFTATASGSDLAIATNASGQEPHVSDWGMPCFSVTPTNDWILSAVATQCQNTLCTLKTMTTLGPWMDTVRRSHELISRESGKCFQPHIIGTGVAQFSCSGSTAQRWRIEASGSNYHLRNGSLGRCLALVNGQVTLETCNGASHEVQITRLGEFTRIRFAQADRCLHLNGSYLNGYWLDTTSYTNQNS
jgi:hypothetical protein